VVRERGPEGPLLHGDTSISSFFRKLDFSATLKHCALPALELLDQVFRGELNIPKNGTQEARTNGFDGVHGNHRHSSIGMPENPVTASGPHDGEAQAFKGVYEFLPSGAEGESYRNLLYPHQFEGAGVVPLLVQTEFDGFAGPLHERVQVLRLGMTPAKAGHSRHQVPVFVALNEHGELAWSLHAKILARSGV
jgi:hypothetical protein